MATLTLQDGSAGLGNVAFGAAAAGGDQVPGGVEGGGWSIPVVLLVNNGDVGSHTATVGGVAMPVPAGATGIIPVRGGVYRGALVPVTYDAVTAVTVAAVALSG